MRRAGRIVLWAAVTVAVLAAAAWGAFTFSPWPAALLIRNSFDKEAAAVSKALEKHLPPGIAAILDEQFLPGDPDARLDVYFPEAGPRPGAPTVVWTHGGGWVSGDKADIGNYARILAGRGFTVASVNYSIAPGATYPTPVRQLSAALGHLAANAGRLRVDPARLVLAGDSAGSHISAQMAAIAADPAYAAAVGVVPAVGPRAIVGMLLFCGAYDTRSVNLDGPFGGFLRTVLWSYSGTREFRTDPVFATASVIDHAGHAFPPSFVSAGNADPLLAQSLAFADRLEAKGVRVDRLFFASDHRPPLPHEYQFNLDGEAGRLALERAVAFLDGL